MNLSAVANDLEPVHHIPDQKESTADRLRRQFCDLEKRVDKYFVDLEKAEEMCKLTRADAKRFQLKAKEEKETVEKDAEIQAKFYSAFKEMKEKVERMKEKDMTPHAQVVKMPDAATRNALWYTTSARVCRYVKIGCALVFDSVAAYVFFKVTEPFLF